MPSNTKKLTIQKYFFDLSLRTKIVFVIVVTSMIILLLSVVSSFLLEMKFLRKNFEKEYRTTARIIASNLETPFAFMQFATTTDAEQILQSLTQQPAVASACAFTTEGKLLAQYSRKGLSHTITQLAPDITEGFRGGELIISEVVMVNGEAIGQVILLAELDELNAHILTQLLMFLIITSLAFALALFLSSKMGKIVSKPILDLALTAERISLDQDFSRRHERLNNDETGRLVDAFNSMMDQIQNNQEVIRANAQRFKRYFELGIVGMGILDQDMRWAEMNDRMLEILGYSQNHLKELSWTELLRDEESEIQRIQLAQVRKGEMDKFSGECWLCSNNKHPVFAMVSLRRVEATQAQPLHFIVLVQDITERKENEERLWQAKEAAEASNRAKNEFLSIMSHELRTPLNPIISFCDLIKEESNNHEHLAYLDIMRSSGQHLLQLIDNILHYVRIERRTIERTDSSIEYQDILDEAIDFCKIQADEKKLKLTVVHQVEDFESTDENPIQLFIDSTILRQLILNLIGNAIKYTEKGSIKMYSTLRAIKGNKGELRVEVKDTGIGIPPESLNDVFEPFAQLDESLTRSHGGIGLGLAICQKIVDAIGGQIGVESQVGKGSTFWFNIPVKCLIESIPNKRNSKPIFLCNDRINAKILLVEDDPNNRLVAESILHRLGIEVVSAKNGVEAVDFQKDTHFDLILMDVQMPIMNGLEATRKIREFESKNEKNIPIVGVTAHVGDNTKKGCHDAGMNDFLPKPFTPHSLQEVLNKWLGEKAIG